MTGGPATPTDQQIAREIESAGRRDPQCPKHMVYGPCGGVRAGGGCEVDERPCPFVQRDVVRWAGPVAPIAPWTPPRPATPARRDAPFIVTDLRVRPFDPASIADVTRHLAPVSDALLLGEHHGRPDFPPSFAAALVRQAGGHPWVTLTCRDRNRVVLEAEIEALAASGVAGVHCVTGDARAPSVRPDASQVFDLDALRLAALARRAGLTVSVAATPTAPPLELRAVRLREKERAGAQVCFVNHAGGPDAVGRFVAASRRAEVRMPFLPCVAVYTDATSFAILAAFPGLELDHVEAERVLSAPDPVAAGIDAAARQARAMLAIDGVVGVNLSGAATAASETASAAIMAAVAGRLRDSDAM